MTNYVLDHTGQQVNTKLTKAENIDNKITNISSSSTDTQYPSAKAVYDQLVLKANKVHFGSITLQTSLWAGNNPYTQTVSLSNYTVTNNTKVDLQPNSTSLTQMLADGCTALYIINNNGILTAYAIGAKLSTNITIQYTAEEVISL